MGGAAQIANWILDTDYDGRLDDIRATPTEIGYVLEVTNRFFPGAKLSAPDVISAFALANG